tara:strand:- start:61 stop:411 length:351 start_codon:yes stop_codon:yes gene_type:complete
MKLETLTEMLHDLHITCGEIITGEDLANKIVEREVDYSVEFTPAEILKATRDAGESFIDSMVQNEHDTEESVKDGLYGGYPIAPLETRVAQWEALRPSKVRKATIAAILESDNVAH